MRFFVEAKSLDELQPWGQYPQDCYVLNVAAYGEVSIAFSDIRLRISDKDAAINAK